MSGRMSEDMSERMAKDMSERISKDISGRMSKDMSERMSEDMSEKNVKRYVKKKMSKKKYVRKNVKRYVTKNVTRYVRKNVKRHVIQVKCQKDLEDLYQDHLRLILWDILSQTLQTLSTSALFKPKAAVFAKTKTEGIDTKMIKNKYKSAVWNSSCFFKTLLPKTRNIHAAMV